MRVQALGMVIVLPDAVDGLSEVAGRLGAEELSQALAALPFATGAACRVGDARFKSEFTADLKEAFQQAGMSRALLPADGGLQRHDRARPTEVPPPSTDRAPRRHRCHGRRTERPRPRPSE